MRTERVTHFLCNINLLFFVIDLKSDKLESGEKAQVITENFFFFWTNPPHGPMPLEMHKQRDVVELISKCHLYYHSNMTLLTAHAELF